VRDVDTTLVTKILEPIWSKKSETAGRLRGRIEAILDWATVRGFRQGENPARWRGHLDKLLPARARVRKAKHHAALPYEDLPEFMRALRDQHGVAARSLEFLNEVIGARPGEIKDKVWIGPEGRMKGGKEHRVPLSERAVAIVEAMKKQHGGEFLFLGGKHGKPLSNMATRVLPERMDGSDLTVHGFRSTFRDWAAERTDFPREVAEMALAHAIDSKVEAGAVRGHRRGDVFEKRIALMTEWARFCASAETTPALRLTIVRAASQAHNLKVGGSNPPPATKKSPADQVLAPGVPGFSCAQICFQSTARKAIYCQQLHKFRASLRSISIRS
jgi:integrase